jgi:hypothetical protein
MGAAEQALGGERVVIDLTQYLDGSAMLVPLLPRWLTASPYEVLEGTTAPDHAPAGECFPVPLRTV